MILAGDIGGTSSRLGLFEQENGRLKLVKEDTAHSQNHSGLEEIVQDFLVSHPDKITAACFGIAGPIRDGVVRTPNLPWVIDSATLASELGLARVGLINDLVANAYGVAMLEPVDFVVLSPGRAEPDGSHAFGNAAIISAGTGLGEAGFFWDGAGYHPFPSEGGHSDFAPRNALEADLLLFLLKRHHRVSYERVVSGPGFQAVYEFLLEARQAEEPGWLTEERGLLGDSAAIARAGVSGKYDLAVEALDLFVSLYGAEAGNLALKLMSTGGMFVGGGIAPKILPKILEGGFMKAFVDKGRHQPLMESIPVKVILNDHTALLGAARCALYPDGVLQLG